MNNTEEKQAGTAKELLQLLSQLVEIQTTNTMLTAKIFIKEGREKVSQKVTAARNTIVGKAKEYGQKAEKIVEQYNLNEEKTGSIMAEYRQSISEINELYYEQMKNILAEKIKMESVEMDDIVVCLKEQFEIKSDMPEDELHFKIEDDTPENRVNKLKEVVNESLDDEKAYVYRDEIEHLTGKGTIHAELVDEQVRLSKEMATLYAKRYCNI